MAKLADTGEGSDVGPCAPVGVQKVQLFKTYTPLNSTELPLNEAI